MLYKLRILLIIFFLTLFNSVSSSKVIDEIDVKGNIRLDDETILSYLSIKKNSKILKSDLNTLFKDLFSTELFSEIKFIIDENKLNILLKENPIIIKDI